MSTRNPADATVRTHQPEALDPSELPDGFEALPHDQAPTRTVPDPPPHPESRGGHATQALPRLTSPLFEDEAPLPPPPKLSPPYMHLTTESASGHRPRRWPWIALATIACLGAVSVTTWHFWPDIQARLPFLADAKTTQPQAPEKVPPELRPYMEKAKAGDAKAMHMIALMYWNGLNVRQDRAKGLEWYRKAAAAGSPAAKQTLASIEGK